ncbi:hypothetical protein ACVWY5_001610 [Bradyrhizobium sp. USDA 3256]
MQGSARVLREPQFWLTMLLSLSPLWIAAGLLLFLSH